MISIVARLETLDGCTQTVDLESYLIEPPEIIRMPMAYPPISRSQTAMASICGHSSMNHCQ